MSEQRVPGAGEPWWASGDADVDRREDPLATWQAVRAAAEEALRAEEEPPPPPPRGADRSLLEEGAEALAVLARLAAGRQQQRARHGGAACRGCPWCTVLRAVGDARPEVLEHLGAAVRHLTLAARAVVDAADEHTDTSWQQVVVHDDDDDDDGTTGWR